MNVEIGNGLKVEINEKDKTATLKKIPEKIDTLIVPRFAEYQKQEYKITSLSFLYNSYEIGFLTFPEDSEVEKIEENCFNGSHIKKLRIPPKLKYLEDGWAACLKDLSEIEISPKNKFFIYYDNKFLIGKSQEKGDQFDVLYFTRRDIEEVVIPDQIRIIKIDSLSESYQMKSVTFSPNSKLEKIEGYAFCNSKFQKLMFPASIKVIGNSIFTHVRDLLDLELHAESVTLKNSCFSNCKKLSTVTFLNATQITIDRNAMENVPENAKFHVRRDVKLAGDGVTEFKRHISYINDNKKVTKIDNKTKKEEEETKPSKKISKKTTVSPDQDTDSLKQFISYLTARLSKYEEVITFEDFMRNPEKFSESGTSDDEDDTASNAVRLIDSNEEKHQKVVSKIGEGATSDVYKVIDERDGHVMCKKVIKEVTESKAFETLKNSMKEIEILLNISHPSICKAIGYNIQEPLPSSSKKAGKSDDDDDEEEEEEKNEHDKSDTKTTIALFFEFLPFTLKKVIESGLMSNTLKARIAIDVAFGMSYIHFLGMIHRDLKLDNIMLNGCFDAKIIDFGLARIDDIAGHEKSLTKGVGTLSYMSPEMVNEEEYDNKTDVYSYGIVLFELFVGRLPKQSMKDKLSNVPIKFPKASSKISKYCIDIIKRCTKFEPSKRPTFDEIINDMQKHSFELASEIDLKTVKARFNELKKYNAKKEKK